MSTGAGLDDRLIFSLVSLASAASWALGSVLWRRIGDQLSPLGINLSKGIIGSCYLMAVLFILGGAHAGWTSLGLLALSGVFGIAVGDTLFFFALMELGPRLASLLGVLHPVFVALSAAVFLNERPSALVWSGIGLTVAGAGWVLWERGGTVGAVRNKANGIRCGLLAIVCSTGAVLLAKEGLGRISVVEATLIRLVSGSIGLTLWGVGTRQIGQWLRPLRSMALLAQVAFVVLVVTFGGFLLSLLALKHIDASVAGVLGSTSPLFVLPMVVFWRREVVSVRALLGTVVAVGGVALILVG